MEEKKFRLRLNLFDCIVVLAALAVGAFLLWRALEPEAPVEVTPQTASTVRYTVRFQRWAPGTSEMIQIGDQIADNVKNYQIGEVVTVQAVPSKLQVLDQEGRRYVQAELEGYEDVLVTILAPCTVTDSAITVGGGYSVRVGGAVYLKGEGYMGSGQIVALEQEVQG